MVDDRPVNFDMESAMLIKKTVDAHMSRIINKVPGRPKTGRRDRPPIYHVKATSEIPAATDSLTGEGRGVARIYRLDTNSELIATEDLLDVVNRNTSVSYAVGDYFEVELRSSEWIPLVAGGGGGGGGACDSCCTSVAVGNMLHPDLTTGFDETTSDWVAQSRCGTAIDPITIPNATALLRLVWSGGTPTLTYEDTGDTFVYEITGDCTILDVDDVDVTGSTSFEAFITMDFALLTVVVSWTEL
jgi:hypothetical protein